jgi:arylsulfatase A-like enzyme
MIFFNFISLIILFFIQSNNSSTINNYKVSNIKQTNLIFLIFDDLRTELSVYDRKHMITPNFERLAKRSVIFDKAYTQVAVCNPARDSLLTGLRPDTTGTYGFQSSFRPHLIFPTQLARSGYNTAGFGKISHWETPDRQIWSFDSWENDWYKYQNFEWTIMNSSTMPDKVRPEELFRDYQFTSRAIDTLKKMSQLPQHFLLALGFKLPHLAVHVPYKYYDMYKSENKSNSWKLTKKELRYPYSSPELSYR